MNKSDLIEHIAKNADISKAVATRALDAAMGGIKTTLRKGRVVNLLSFGSFYIGKRAVRTGRSAARQPVAASRIWTQMRLSEETK